jgi:chromosome segregation ATPase
MAEEQWNVLPESLDTWVSERAAASDEEPADVVSRAVTLYRLVEEHAEATDGEMPPADEFDELVSSFDDHVAALDDRVSTIEETADDNADRVTALDGRVVTVEDDLDEKITDVRERVIQVKREADGKAPADHDHPALDERIERAGTTAVEANTRVDDLETRVDSGFENFEEILEHVADDMDDRDEKLTKFASIVVDLRRRLAEVEHAVATADAAAGLKTAANRQGETVGNCGECDSRIAIGLLTEPNCPHCGAEFSGVESSGRFFGSATLTTERRLALTAGDDPADDDRAVEPGSASDGTETESKPSTVTELFEGVRRE